MIPLTSNHTPDMLAHQIRPPTDGRVSFSPGRVAGAPSTLATQASLKLGRAVPSGAPGRSFGEA